MIQYRLGFLGFMNYQDETGQTVGGNFGLNDQLIALKFIHGNKANLGCSRITINGESVTVDKLLMTNHFTRLKKEFILASVLGDAVR